MSEYFLGHSGWGDQFILAEPQSSVIILINSQLTSKLPALFNRLNKLFNTTFDIFRNYRVENLWGEFWAKSQALFQNESRGNVYVNQVDQVVLRSFDDIRWIDTGYEFQKFSSYRIGKFRLNQATINIRIPVRIPRKLVINKTM